MYMPESIFRVTIKPRHFGMLFCHLYSSGFWDGRSSRHMKIIKGQGKTVPIHIDVCLYLWRWQWGKSPWKIRLHLFNSSQMFWSQDLFMLLKIIADPKQFYLCKLYLSVSTILEIITKKNLKHKNTQTHIPLAVRTMPLLQVI